MHRRTRRNGRSLLTIVAAVVALCAVTFGTQALAAKLSGSKKSDKIAGTKGADKIKGKGGNDKLKGKGGNDTLNGGKGRDTVTGGAGADKHLGGPGNDLINAADNRRDKAINGGAGKDRCVIDAATELTVARNCETIVGGGAGGSGPPPGPGEGLRVSTVAGLVGCGSTAPVCVFEITGDGADAPAGTVTGGGGVTAVGGAVTTAGTGWTAAGVYGCQGDGTLTVTIGTERLTLPIQCG